MAKGIPHVTKLSQTSWKAVTCSSSLSLARERPQAGNLLDGTCLACQETGLGNMAYMICF